MTVALMTSEIAPLDAETVQKGVVGVVVIGRNEGERLGRCLETLAGLTGPLIYVDSQSTDGSRAVARAAGADVIALDGARPCTAARARNAGMAALAALETPPEFVQFIDGDCMLDPAWLDASTAFLSNRGDVAVVCGRRRERFADKTVFNWLIDREWDTPVGLARACGGDALARLAALDGIGGFDPALIAGEEPEMCIRLRQAGWTIWRLDAEMTLHDADITRLSQWWKRSRRAGHTYAEGMAMHGRGPEYHGVRQTGSALVWGVAVPACALAGLWVTPWSALLVFVWPAQMIRLGLKQRSLRQAVFLVLAKFPEAQGAVAYWWRRLFGRKTRLIEYK